MADYVSSFSGSQIDSAVGKVLNGGVPVLDESGKIPAAQLPDAGFSVVLMSAADWAEGTYSFEASYPHAQFDIEISVAPTATVEQFEAFSGAMICGGVGSNVVTALNGAPSVDVPVIVKAVAK